MRSRQAGKKLLDRLPSLWRQLVKEYVAKWKDEKNVPDLRVQWLVSAAWLIVEPERAMDHRMPEQVACMVEVLAEESQPHAVRWISGRGRALRRCRSVSDPAGSVPRGLAAESWKHYHSTILLRIFKKHLLIRRRSPGSAEAIVALSRRKRRDSFLALCGSSDVTADSSARTKEPASILSVREIGALSTSPMLKTKSFANIYRKRTSQLPMPASFIVSDCSTGWESARR